VFQELVASGFPDQDLMFFSAEGQFTLNGNVNARITDVNVLKILIISFA
jgi:hypothetical protein